MTYNSSRSFFTYKDAESYSTIIANEFISVVGIQEKLLNNGKSKWYVYTMNVNAINKQNKFIDAKFLV